MLKASGQKEAAMQMERQIKHGQELARIQGFAISQDAKRKLIGEAGMRFAAESQQSPSGNILSRTLDLFSSKFQMAAGPVMQAVKQQLTEQAGQLTKNAGDLGRAAFSPLRGDLDISAGRGSNINTLRSSASEQIKQMMKQSALLKSQADKIDQSNSLLADIAASVKDFNPKLSYN
jgi:pyruvate-formate lyase